MNKSSTNTPLNVIMTSMEITAITILKITETTSLTSPIMSKVMRLHTNDMGVGALVASIGFFIVTSLALVLLSVVWLAPALSTFNTNQQSLQSSVSQINTTVASTVNKTLLSSGTFVWSIVSSGGQVCDGPLSSTYNFYDYAIANGISTQVISLDAPSRALDANDTTCEGSAGYVYVQAYNFDPIFPQLGSFIATQSTISMSTYATDTMLAQTCSGGTTCFIGTSDIPPITYPTSLVHSLLFAGPGTRRGFGIIYQSFNETDIFPFTFYFDPTQPLVIALSSGI